jgi:hypothetical protein
MGRVRDMASISSSEIKPVAAPAGNLRERKPGQRPWEVSDGMRTQALIVLLLATARLAAPAADASPRQVPLPLAQATRTRARHAMIAGCAASSLAGQHFCACLLLPMLLLAAHAAASEGLRT